LYCLQESHGLESAPPGWLSKRARSRHGLLRFWLCFIGVAWTGLASLAHAAPLDTPDSARIERIEWLHDPSGQLEIDEVVAASAHGHFQSISSAQGVGFRPGTVWLRLTVWGGNRVVNPHWLLLHSPLVLEAQLFSPTPTGFEADVTVGLESPPEERALPIRFPVFEISPAPGYTSVYFVRMQSNAMVWLAPRVLKSAELFAWFKSDQLLFGSVVACHALLMLSSLWFARQAQDRSYAWLAAVTGANLLFTLGTESLFLQQMLRDHRDWFMPLISAARVIRVPLAGAFVLSHLRADRHHLSRGYLIVLTLTAFAEWLLRPEAGPQLWVRWYQLWSIAQLGLFLLFAFYATRRGTPGARLLILAFLPPLAGALQSAAVVQDGLPITFWSANALRLGFAGFLIVMQYAAFRRYRDLRLAYERTRNETLENSRAAAKQLEARVSERTGELHAALSTAKSSLATEERAREEQSQFFLTMQHELRTPLAVIDAANRNLQRALPAGFEMEQLHCQRIGRAVEQLNTLLKNSLRQARLGHDQTVLQLDRTEIRPLMQEVYDAAHLLSPNHALVLQLDDLPEHWVCDPALTVLALRTLTVNAVKYTPAGTRVTLRGSSDADGLYLEVCDEGPGVPADQLPYLFERYYRAGNATGIPGTGLGLPLARKMVELQGGRLEVDSVEHEGFTAMIWLPRQADHSTEAQQHCAVSPGASSISPT